MTPVPDRDRNRLEEELLRAFPDLQGVYLFGSAASGASREDSDVDLGLLLPPGGLPPDPWKLGETGARLEGILGRPVDLVDLRRADTVFRHQVVSTGRLLLARDRRATGEFEMLTLSFYQKLNEERREILEEIRRTGRVLHP